MKIEQIGTIPPPETEDGGCALIFRGIADTMPEDWNEELPGFRIDAVSYHEADRPDHSCLDLLTRNVGKKVRVTIEVME